MKKICSMCNKEKELTEFKKRGGARKDHRANCKGCDRAYRQTPKGRQLSRANNARMRKLYPEKFKARRNTRYAIRAGVLVQQPCRDCGELEVQVHHEDYSKPLEVIWLCDPCHREVHNT